MDYVSHRVDYVQERSEECGILKDRHHESQIFRFKPQFRSQTKICTTNPKWDEQVYLTETHSLLPVIQDDEIRMSTWLLRSGSMNKIDGKTLVVLLTIHSSGNKTFNGPIGKVSIIVKSGTESNQWHSIISEGGAVVKGGDGKQSAVQLQISYFEKEIETPLC
mmetsp:Transcript_45306/g.94903  ORF Transcript_45306/g.94903 Transcript_45306/m.94903 type:complete len:163 (+) Transcript_45306:4760-5248(+)